MFTAVVIVAGRVVSGHRVSDSGVVALQLRDSSPQHAAQSVRHAAQRCRLRCNGLSNNVETLIYFTLYISERGPII